MNKLIRATIALLIMISSAVVADDYRPAYIEMNQVSESEFDLIWKVPAVGEDLRLSLHLDFPSDVTLEEPIYMLMGGAHIERRRVTREQSWVGAEVRVLGLDRTNKDVLARVEWLDGSSETARMNSANTSFAIQGAPSFINVLQTYLLFGVEHILEGFDHLLFIACLVFIAGDMRRILITITGFTLAHSVTLALAALQVVRLPLPPTEAIVALSIAFLAREIIKPERDTITWRYPIAISSAFGLLHGFGFAAALTEVGLPSNEIPTALIAFNIGVEIGQVAFVLVYLGVVRLMSIKHAGFEANTFSLLRRYQVPMAYVIAVVSLYWTLERISYFWI
ncbi:HupE/UreJ family protein [Vibrio sp. WXL210]|uniref:HupE/UreJ family protein n=1 Tax=Vibrio sp. WXL210 TaxID=3450709 RepID=UPI003EC54B5A